jgi:hypothetical protein
MTRHLEQLVDSSRIRATPQVMVAENVAQTIQTASSAAAVAFLGFEAPEEGQEALFFNAMERLAGKLRKVVFVDSAGGMELET